MDDLSIFFRDNRAKYIAIARKNLRCTYQDAEDVVQEAFLRASKGFHNYDPNKGKIPSWFSRIINASMADYRRQLNKEFDNFLEEGIVATEIDEDIFDGVDNKTHKEILLKHFSQGETKSEIASEYGLKIETVSKIINKFLSKVAL